MSITRIARILCVADPEGADDAMRSVLKVADDQNVQAVAVVGDMKGPQDTRATYRSLFKAITTGGRSAYWVPGPGDAPLGDYLREAQNIEVAQPFMHGVHGTAARAPDGHVVFAGLGGEIGDGPDAPRDEVERLQYPAWEAEYRLKLLREFEHLPQLVLLFSTPPAHKGRGMRGSEELAELIATQRARLVVCGGERGTETLGRTTVVSPGSLSRGQYGIADLHNHEVELLELAAMA